MDAKVKNRKRKAFDKPLCKYGAVCFRKNPDHLKRFKHLTREEYLAQKKPVNDDSKEIKTKESLPVIDKNPISSPCSSDYDLLPSPCNSSDSDTDPASSPGSGSDVDSNRVSLSYKVSAELRIEESVGDIFKLMPKDFFAFWRYCSSVNKSKPQDAFIDFGYKLVGVYDLLAKRLPPDMKVDISCHWRYFYDPPEFQTVIKKDGDDLYHIGYFRDDPTEMPTILASNSAAVNEKLTLKGDNIFCAMNVELDRLIKSSNSKFLKNKAISLQESLCKFAAQKEYSIHIQTDRTKKRQKAVVAKTFHGLGIVVPVKNDVGYRPLPESDASLKKILRKIVTAESEDMRLDAEEFLDEILSNVNFANDECDYGMGYELGIDLFCYGDPYLHKHITSYLSLAYNLLKRSKYATILKAHLANREKGVILKTLDV